jgi:hypothetical protein
MSTKKEARSAPDERLERLCAPERVQKVSWFARQLWSELRAWLRVLEMELEWLGGGGEAPVLECRARVRMMRGVMQGLGGDHRQLCAEAGDELEAWRWLEEFDNTMERWLKALAKDLSETGTTPEGKDLRDDTWFTEEYGQALGLFKEAYRDWWFVAWTLASIEASQVSEREIARIDGRCKFIATRSYARRAARNEMPYRNLSWVAS